MRNKKLSAVCLNFINDCENEFKDIDNIVKKIGKTSNEIPYLTRYALIKAHGTIEQCYKHIIIEVCETGAASQMKNFFDFNFVNKAANLKYENIEKNLSYFDKTWPKLLNKEMKKFSVNESRMKTSLKSLVESRNEFAHGLNPQISYRDIKKYFDDSKKVMIKIKTVIC